MNLCESVKSVDNKKMKTHNRQYVQRGGSALILVVVVTVLLAVIGVMFLMVARASELETAAVVQNKDLNNAVDTVVAKINETLVEDLFNATGFVPNAQDSTNDDPWLCDLEPVWDSLNDLDGIQGTIDDIYVWPRITDLWGVIQANPDSLHEQSNHTPAFFWVDPDNDSFYGAGSWDDYKVSADNVRAKIIGPKDRAKVILQGAGATAQFPDPWDNPVYTASFGARADADGDGVADSRWVQIPALTTSRGAPVFAAIRIIDNCAMLNLNTAFGFYQDPSDTDPWHTERWYLSANDAVNNTSPYLYDGRTLGEINYTPFLRARDKDHVERLQLARDPLNLSPLPEDYHNQVVMNVEMSLSDYSLFRIDDELEIRNRYLLTSKSISRFEKRHLDNENRDAFPPNPYSGTLYYTFDFGRGIFAYDNGAGYGKCRVPSTPFTTVDFSEWMDKLNPLYFDSDPGPFTTYDYQYDRRHLCTFYSFDRNLPKGDYPQLDAEIDAFAFAYLATSGFSNVADYKEYLWDQLGPVFVPKGTATTNIETPLYTAAPYNNVETRRKILHLLYAFRAYYMQPAQGLAKPDAAKKAAQIVANIIDFADGNFGFDPVAEDDPKDYGPFYDDGTAGTIDYGGQANLDCTFINKDIIDKMIAEVGATYGVTIPAAFDFGFPVGEVVFGYERQPFISEVYAEWDGDLPNPLVAFAVELVNPYPDPIDLTGYSLDIASQASSYPLDGQQVPGYNLVSGLGRLVIRRGAVTSTGGNVNFFDVAFPTTMAQSNDNTISLLRSNPSDSGTVDIVVDQVFDSDYDDPNDPSGTIFQDPAAGGASRWSAARDDSQWKFAQPVYRISEDAGTIGDVKDFDPNTIGIQLACPSDGYSVSRLHDLETLSLFGNGTDQNDPNGPVTKRLFDAATGDRYFDLDPNSTVYSAGLIDYIAVMNRPDKGTLPGRININTAPVHVIAAAIPPSLVKLTTANPAGLTAMDYAQAIVDNRPYETLGQLLEITGSPGQPDFKWYAANTNVGQPSIEGDIEERDWILSHLANKFTVRSDTFTAYILVRLGEDGPQRRMIGIFDRSQVWDTNDRPKLVALHPVPDPR
jgi:hypothetical protein